MSIYANVKNEIVRFFEVNGIPYNVEIVLTESNKTYITAIRKLTTKLTTKEDFEMWKDVYHVEYKGDTFVPVKINGWLKFSVSNKKKIINWNNGGIEFGGSEEKEKVKSIIQELINELEGR